MSISTLQLDISWPAIPLPVLDYSATPIYNTIISGDETLVVERRSRFTKSYYGLAVTWNFSNTEFETFRSFFSTTLSNGSAQFNLELRFPLNTALTHWAVRFTDVYKASYVEGRWTVSAALDLLSTVSI